MTPQIADVVERRSEHTPGPWACTTRQGSWDWVVYSASDPNIEVCQMFHDGTEFNEVGEANARLIAAAPELLEACVTVRNWLDVLHGEKPTHSELIGAIASLNSAIAHAAQGETRTVSDEGGK